MATKGQYGMLNSTQNSLCLPVPVNTPRFGCLTIKMSRRMSKILKILRVFKISTKKQLQEIISHHSEQFLSLGDAGIFGNSFKIGKF